GVWAISFLVRAFAIGQVSSGLSLLAVAWLHLRPQEFAIAVGGNTIIVAALQLPALRLLRRRRRSSALFALAVGLGLVWLVFAVGPVAAGTTLQFGGPALYLAVMLCAALLIGLLARQLAGQLSTIQDTIG